MMNFGRWCRLRENLWTNTGLQYAKIEIRNNVMWAKQFDIKLIDKVVWNDKLGSKCIT